MKPTYKIILLVLAIVAVGYVLVDSSQEFKSYSLMGNDSYTTGIGGESMMYAEDAAVPMMDLARVTSSQFYEPPYEPTAGKTAAEVDQKVIKTGAMTLLVDSIGDTLHKINEIAEQNEGFTQNSNSGDYPSGEKFGYTTIRVPADRYDSVMSLIRAEGLKTIDESTNAQDVTEQFTDLQARLGVAQNEELAYLALLNRAGSVSDLLQVQRELSNVRSRIESLEGQIQYMENQTSLSTISVSLQEEASLSIPTKPFRFMSTVRDAFHGAISLVQQIVVALVWIVIVGVIVGVPIGLVLWIGRKAWNRSRK